MKLRRSIGSATLAALLLAAGCSNEVHPRIRYGDGLQAYQKGNLTAATADFQSAYQKRPGHANTCYWLGRCHLDTARKQAQDESLIAAMTYADKAIFYFESAIKIAPSHVLAIKGRAEAARLKGDYAKALATAEGVGHLLTPTADILMAKARAYADGGDMDRALITWRQAAITEHDNPAALEAYGRALLIAGERDRALGYLRKAYEIRPSVAVLETLYDYGAVPDLAPDGNLKSVPMPADLPRPGPSRQMGSMPRPSREAGSIEKYEPAAEPPQADVR